MTFVATWQGVGVSFFWLALYPLVQEPLLLEHEALQAGRQHLEGLWPS